MKVKPFFIFGVVIVLSFLVAVSNSLSIQALEFAHKTMWGEKGIAYGQFKQTSGVAIDSENNVYVADLTGYSTRMIPKVFTHWYIYFGLWYIWQRTSIFLQSNRNGGRFKR